jgi:hypothetical protein
VICNHQKELFDYTIRWLAHLVQRPTEKPEVAVVLKGGKGVGKDTLAILVSKIVGKRHVAMVDRPDLLTGRFNGHLASALLAHVQEAFWSGDRSRKGTLQALITSSTISLERKGIDPITIDSYLRIIMTTNEVWAVPASHDERRYFVLDVSDAHQGDREYFRNLYAEINGEALCGFFDYLFQVDLTGWEPRDVPQTSGLIDQKLESLEGFERWWFDLLSTGKLPAQGTLGADDTKDWEAAPAGPLKVTVSKELMRRSYHSFLRARRFAGDPISAAMFGKKIASFGAVPALGRENEVGKRAWEYRLLPLDQARARFEAFIGGTIRWRDND